MWCVDNFKVLTQIRGRDVGPVPHVPLGLRVQGVSEIIHNLANELIGSLNTYLSRSARMSGTRCTYLDFLNHAALLFDRVLNALPVSLLSAKRHFRLSHHQLVSFEDKRYLECSQVVD